MHRYMYFNNNQQQPKNSKERLKADALRALREALFKEEYERCAVLINSARAMGALRTEIDLVMNEYAAGIQRQEEEDEDEEREPTSPRF